MQRTFMQFFKKEVGLVFVHVLEDAGVYKCTPKRKRRFYAFCGQFIGRVLTVIIINAVV